jgi:hypothetical protein
MRTLFDDACRTDVLARLRHVRPDTRPSWGRMTAPQMVVHLADQMRMTLGNAHWTRMPPAHLRWPGMKQAALYRLPWPKGRIQGPPEVFVTTHWPEHSHSGRLNGGQWGVFCYRHFDHHLTQFGA